MISIPSEFFNRRFFHETFGKRVIHVEAPHLSKNQLENHLRKYNSTCYCITPVNYDYVRKNLGCSLSKKEFHAFLKEFYSSIKRKGINLQLHVHISQELGKVPFSTKRKLIGGAYNFFKDELKITPKEIVYGWTSFDDDCINISKSLGLKSVTYKHFHIYDFWLKQSKPYHNRSVDSRQKMVSKIARGKILDIGFADNPNYYLRGEVTGIDMKKTSTPNNYSKCIVGNFNSLINSKIKESFDAVTALEFIEHIENPSEFFRNCKKFLKRGGILILTTPTPYYWRTILGNLAYPKGRATIIPHLHDFIPRILNNVAMSEGFEVVDVKNVNSKIPFVNWQLLYVYKKK